MRLLFLDHLDPEPGKLLEWTAIADPGPAFDPTPPTSNQAIHLSSGSPTNWLAAQFEVAGPIDEAALEAAFAAWIPRHDALHCCFAQPAGGGPVAVHLVSDTDIRLERRAPVAADSTAELRALLGARLDAACDPFRFPPYFLGAVSRPEISTVIVGFDHAICDAWSITIAVTELDELYRAALDEGDTTRVALPEAGSFLCYSGREAAVPSATTGPLIRGWRDFLREAGDDLPHFPVDLGIPAGSRAPFGGDVRPLLGPTATDALHRRARAAGHSLFAALLAPVALAAAELGGGAATDLVFPVHTRREPRHHNTFGWLVANAPARVPAAKDFATTVAGADAAIRNGQRLAHVPATQVLAALGPELRRTRHDLFSVSYTDYRHLPGGSRCDTTRTRPRNPVQFSRSASLDDVQLWFTRTDDGLSLRTRFPDTPTARPLVTDFLDRVAKTLVGAAQGG
ncbi:MULTISPECIES: condensation domain-containing protein [unclassified Nocardia]|uniref:condensation domain-containing protein n=1 Tax=unclassified Nocardia TaxID=2637762 RepID=UPI001CE3DC93|nr:MULTISPECIES: condensation domain-containing protein [unclassified Nocardia]